MPAVISPKEIVESLRGFFEEKKMKFNLRDEDKKEIYVVFEFSDEHGVLSEEEFESFLDLLNSLGFHHVDEAENMIKDFILYKELLVHELYSNSSEDVAIHLKYYAIKSEINIIYLSRVTVAVRGFVSSTES